MNFLLDTTFTSSLTGARLVNFQRDVFYLKTIKVLPASESVCAFIMTTITRGTMGKYSTPNATAQGCSRWIGDIILAEPNLEKIKREKLK